MLCFYIGTFHLLVELDDVESYTCAESIDPVLDNTEIFEKILTCTFVYTQNKIKISNTGERHIKVYEVKIMGNMKNI